MSSFVTGLVRRGAGLPQPVAIRPVPGPQNVPHPFGATKATDEGRSDALPDESQRIITSDLATSEFSTRIAPAVQPMVEVRPRGDLSGSKLEDKPRFEMQERASISGTRRVAIPQHTVPRALGSEEVRLMPRANDGDAKRGLEEAATTSTTLPNFQGGGIAKSSRTVQESGPPQQTILPRRESQPVRANAAANSIPLRLEAQQEPAAVVRPQNTVSTPPTEKRETTSERRSIQVKIGRVEIRSSQPTSVVRATGPRSSGGFDDLKLARAYLDRNLR